MGEIKQNVRWDELYFFIGVVSVMVSSWLVGAFPHCYWVQHCIMIFILLIIRISRFTRKGYQFWLLDYCYVINYMVLMYYMLSVAGACPFHKYIFRIVFSSCVGPLAISVAAFRNSLVFHSADNLIILALHFSPNIAIWGMRWFSADLERDFPNTFHVCDNNPTDRLNLFFSNTDCPGSFTDLYLWPVFVYAILWATPYYLFFFIIGKEALRKGGYYTMFDDMSSKPAVKKVLSIGGDWGKEFKYMVCHGLAVYLVLFLGPVLWHSFILHTAYLVSIVGVSVYNGGTYYFRVFAKKYYNEAMKEVQDHEQQVEKQELELADRYLGEHQGLNPLSAVNDENTGDDCVDAGHPEP